MRLADRLDPANPVEDLGRGGVVIVPGPRPGPGRQHARIIRSAQKNADAALDAERQERGQRLLLQERIAPGQQEQVEIALPRQRLADLPFVHPRADGADHAFLAQPQHGLVAAGHQLPDPGVRGGLGPMGENIDVMGEQDIDAVDPESLQRCLHRAHHAVMRIVIDLPPAGRFEKLADPRALLRRAHLKQPPDLGGEHIAVPWLAAQEAVQPRLRQAEAIERGGVVKADARPPGGLQRRPRRLLAQWTIEIAERGGAEAEFGEGDPGA